VKVYPFDEYDVYEVGPSTYVLLQHGDSLAKVLGGFDPEDLGHEETDKVFVPCADEFGHFTDGHVATRGGEVYNVGNTGD